jgi:hypothetical protein
MLCQPTAHSVEAADRHQRDKASAVRGRIRLTQGCSQFGDRTFLVDDVVVGADISDSDVRLSDPESTA